MAHTVDRHTMAAGRAILAAYRYWVVITSNTSTVASVSQKPFNDLVILESDVQQKD